MSAAECRCLGAHGARIAAHYEHAREKHPRFADTLFYGEEWHCFKADSKRDLESWRHILLGSMELGVCDAATALRCEVAEVKEAYARGDKAHAVEECYDAIAVLLRMVDVLEGRQPLGRVEKGIADSLEEQKETSE